MSDAPIKKRLFLVIAIAASLVIGTTVEAEAPEPVFPKLTPKLQDLLRREMVSLNEASQQILTGLISGDDASVAELAQRIHDSFILQQEMTPEDRDDLMAAVPEEFVRMDRAFHDLSAELAEAATTGDMALQHERFGQMLQACTACHSRYATDRFTGFGD